jgi:hypothetical protein
MNSLPDSGFGWIPGGRFLADRINQRANNFKAADPFGGFFCSPPIFPTELLHIRGTLLTVLAIAEVPLDFRFQPVRDWDFSQPGEKPSSRSIRPAAN